MPILECSEGNISRTRGETGHPQWPRKILYPQGGIVEAFSLRTRPPTATRARTRPHAAAQATLVTGKTPRSRAFASVAPALSFGRGASCKGSAGSPDPRTLTNRHDEAQCDPLQWLASGCEGRLRRTPARTRGKTAHGSAAAAEALASRPAARTMRDSPRWHGAGAWVCARGTSRPVSAPGIQRAGTAEAVYPPWAITSMVTGKTKRAETNNRATSALSLAPALKALALFHVHDVFLLAFAAVGDNPPRNRVSRNLDHLAIPAPSGRTPQVAVLHC